VERQAGDIGAARAALVDAARGFDDMGFEVEHTETRALLAGLG
jgi:hypothetical protein